MTGPLDLNRAPTWFRGTDAASRSDVDALARARKTLLRRDDEYPARWSSPTFVAGVAAERAALSPILTSRRLLGAWRRRRDRERLTRRPFDETARGLAGDPVHVAFALRRLELDRGTRLAAWPDVLRHRALIWVRVDEAREAAVFLG